MHAHRFAEVLKTHGDDHVPVHADGPESNVIFIDTHDPHVHALGTKTISMRGVDRAAAIASAILHATGTCVRGLPTTLNHVL